MTGIWYGPTISDHLVKAPVAPATQKELLAAANFLTGGAVMEAVERTKTKGKAKDK